jgi:hypothetical protein
VQQPLVFDTLIAQRKVSFLLGWSSDAPAVSLFFWDRRAGGWFVFFTARRFAAELPAVLNQSG